MCSLDKVGDKIGRLGDKVGRLVTARRQGRTASDKLGRLGDKLEIRHHV